MAGAIYFLCHDGDILPRHVLQLSWLLLRPSQHKNPACDPRSSLWLRLRPRGLESSRSDPTPRLSSLCWVLALQSCGGTRSGLGRLRACWWQQLTLALNPGATGAVVYKPTSLRPLILALVCRMCWLQCSTATSQVDLEFEEKVLIHL